MIETEVQARAYVKSMVGEAAFERVERLTALLLAENQRQNLISKASESQIWQRHMADSAQLLEHVPRETLNATSDPWLDLGTGAGPPGLVIAALLPDLPVCLVESRGRRVEFLQSCVDELGLSQCRVIGDRLERIEPFPVNVISARAFAPLDKLLRLSAPFSTGATRYLLPKGRSAAHELKQQKKPIRAMFHVEQSLTDREAGIIVST
ncbi:16S rRNA (guanine(527)-N(7))-methyltransferase RsmG [Erythrobacter sp. F6033]|uniref:16S rRNA (guanine(527)-N(7))-methyltransferase RsmG n=1 Tax=Erythrobacter sp. F6033 TaxID=2926401 RepID=UPI001FF2F6F6|nr:16S rRNA (guanine(527)-N(7))-methyltransferase RsmG [Erythrobacter sp. F6033]MCK0129753.1 16S rRNA (guanine(527)-N(7))-methyltransferase RsmG [Erythrobacter sp. F6033]